MPGIKKAPVKRTFDALVKEAGKPPYVLTAGDKEIKIYEPTARQLSSVSAADKSDLRAMISPICGAAADEVWELAADQPVSVLNALVREIMEHFNYSLGE